MGYIIYTVESLSIGFRITRFRITRFRITGFRITGFRITGFRITGFRITGFRITGFRITGFRITGFCITGFRITGFRITGARDFRFPKQSEAKRNSTGSSRFMANEISISNQHFHIISIIVCTNGSILK